jgi:hypothetical protein
MAVGELAHGQIGQGLLKSSIDAKAADVEPAAIRGIGVPGVDRRHRAAGRVIVVEQRRVAARRCLDESQLDRRARHYSHAPSGRWILGPNSASQLGKALASPSADVWKSLTSDPVKDVVLANNLRFHLDGFGRGRRSTVCCPQ